MTEVARLPTEFRYFEHIGSRRARRLGRALRLLFGKDIRLPDEVVRTWGTTYFDADPVAEAFVEEVSRVRGRAATRELLDRALSDGVDAVPDAPPSLVRLFRELEEPPPWYDERVVELGAKVFRSWGTHLFSFAGAITLEGYRESSVAKPLAFTGAYTGESAERRFLETAAFWVDVAQPGALAPGGKGRATALRVRLLHVDVRRRLLAHPGWRLDDWGVPISQGDALLTLMGGSVVPGYGLRLLGHPTSGEEIEATLAFWRWVGHLMGVQPRWYPANRHEAVGLMYASMVKGARTSGEDGVNLARSYLESYRPRPEHRGLERLERTIEYGLERGAVSWFVPAESRRHYGLPGAGAWRCLLLAGAPVTLLRELLRRRSRRVDAWVDRRTAERARRWVERRLGARRAEYRPVEHFTR